MLIRPFLMEDYLRCYEMWSRTPGMGLSDSDSEDGIRTFLERNPGLSFVAEDGAGGIQGTVLAGHDGRRGFLYHLAVSPECRGRGTGGELVMAALDALRAQGIVKCHIMVLENNAIGQAFWSRQGWLKRDDLFIYSCDLIDGRHTGGSAESACSC